ncbi:hypothetical protein [Nocardia thailandica]|uniref:hypothetical protein n=1 Tax=Nocardia thailandica TaxID=257275 RepID=UPI0002F07EC4|nr:hypothetical protein [Nocardia thailandica]
MKSVMRSAATAVGTVAVVVLCSGPAAAESGFEGDHTAIDAQVCLDTGGHLDGLICVGGPYTGYITR